jgi:hypothetical protein
MYIGLGSRDSGAPMSIEDSSSSESCAIGVAVVLVVLVESNM